MKPKEILEVGTAISFSASIFAKYTDANIQTIERNPTGALQVRNEAKSQHSHWNREDVFHPNIMGETHEKRRKAFNQMSELLTKHLVPIRPNRTTKRRSFLNKSRRSYRYTY